MLVLATGFIYYIISNLVSLRDFDLHFLIEV